MANVYQFDEYRTAKGDKALSIRITLNDMGQLHETELTQKRSHLASTRKSARRHLDKFQLPESIRRDARRAARQLTDVFVQVFSLQRIADQTSGRLDRRKLSTIARHSAAGTYDPNQVRPYRRVIPTPSTKPKIVIVASAGLVELVGDYVPNLVTLTLGIQWACEAAGLDVCTAFTEGHYKNGNDIMAWILSESGKPTPASYYGLAFQEDGSYSASSAWTAAQVIVWASDKAGATKMAAHEGKSVNSVNYPNAAWPSRNGGNATRWAREVLGADIVVAIGDVADACDADIKLGAGFSLDQAVQEIIRQARRLDRVA
jgi:hypothetical protein